MARACEMQLPLNTYLCLIAITILTRNTLQHYIPPPSPCLLAQFCNHTGLPLCGKQDEDKRKFLDDCDMFEFNCDYHKEFKQVANEECEIMSIDSETSSVTTTITTLTSSETSTPISSPITSNSTPIIIISTTESISSIISSSIESTTPTTISSTIESKATITTPSTTESVSTTIITSTLERTNLTTTYPITNSSNDSTTEKSTDIATTEYKQVTINYTCTTDISNITTEESTSEIPASVNTEKSSTSAKANSKTITYSTLAVTCNTYPKDCDRPVTWETTSKGETRDFYQILRAQYGNRVKLLKATTHWPTSGLFYRFNEENFRFGRHNES